MSNITKDEVIDWLSGQSVLEIAELVSALEEKWGVSAAAPVAVAAAAPALGHRRGEVRVPDERVPSHHVHVAVNHRVPVIERSNKVTRHAPGPQELILAQVLLKVRWVWSHGEYVEAVRGMTTFRGGRDR